jgi:hypothetical protein
MYRAGDKILRGVSFFEIKGIYALVNMNLALLRK